MKKQTKPTADEIVSQLTTSRDERRARRQYRPATKDTHPQYEHAVLVRQSSKRAIEGADPKANEFAKMLQMTIDRADVRDLPGADIIRSIGTDMVRNDARGFELRKEYNATPLIDRSNNKTIVGYMIVIEGVAYILAVFSAAKTTETVTEDDLVTIDNAFSVAVAQIVERHDVKHLHIGPFHRLVRHKQAAQRLEAALIRNATTIWADTGPIDMRTETGRDTFTLNVLIGEKQYIGTVQSLTNGQLALLEYGQWHKTEEGLPAAGYKFRDRENNDRTPVPNLEMIPMIKDIIKWAADETKSTADIAKMLGEKYEWVSGVAQSRNKTKTIRIDKLRHPETAVINLLRKGLPLWLSGRYAMKVGISQNLATEKLRTGSQERMRTIDGTNRRLVEFDLDFHHEDLPGGKWADEKTIRKAIELRFGSAQAKPTGRAAAHNLERKPLSGIGEWVDGQTQFALSARNVSNYIIKSRPVADAFDPETGARRGWLNDERGVIATINPAEIHKAIADAIAEQLDTETGLTWRRGATIGMMTSGADADSENTAALAKELQAIETEIEDAEFDLALARKERMQETAIDRMRIVEAARKRHRELQERITNAGAIRAQRRALTTDARADIGQIAATLAALAKTEDRAPATLNNLLRQFIVDLTARPNNDTTITIECSARIQTTDGPIIVGPIKTTVSNRARELAETRKTTLAGYVFRDGMTVEEAAAAAGYKDVAYARRRLHLELDKSGIMPSTELRAAAIQCPIRETKAVLWEAHQAALEGRAPRTPKNIDPAFAAHIIETYTAKDAGWVRHWANGDHNMARRAIAGVKAAGKGGMEWERLLEWVDADATPDQQRLISAELASGKGVRFGGTRALQYEPVLKRSEPWHRHADRRVWVHDCPFCGTATIDHVLRVPEIPGGMICSKCRRTPKLPTVQFPKDYLTEWDGHR